MPIPNINYFECVFVSFLKLVHISRNCMELGMQRYHFFRSDPIQKIQSIGQFRSDPSAGFFLLLFFFLINVEFLYFCVTLLCVKHNLLDNFVLMKNNMKIYIGAVYTWSLVMRFVI